MVACSETESTSGSVVVKKGLIAFRYLKLADGKKSEPIEKTEKIMIKNASKNKNIFLCGFLLKFLITNNTVINDVDVIRPRPLKPNIKSIPGLSKLTAVRIVDNTNKGIDQKRNLLSFLKNGSDMKNNPKGITKN